MISPGSWKTCNVRIKSPEPGIGGFRGVAPPGQQSAQLLDDVQRED